MSWHNMGLDEGSWSGCSEPEREYTKEELEAAARLSQEMKEKEARFKEELASRAHLSLAHARQAEGGFGYYPKEAIEICGDGYVTMMAQSFEDDSLLIFQVGEMGIEDIKTFGTLWDAQRYLNTLIDFEPR